MRNLIEKSPVYNSFPIFKQKIIMSKSSIERISELYGQANRLGIDYLKQNPNITISTVNLIESMLNKS